MSDKTATTVLLGLKTITVAYAFTDMNQKLGVLEVVVRAPEPGVDIAFTEFQLKAILPLIQEMYSEKVESSESQKDILNLRKYKLICGEY